MTLRDQLLAVLAAAGCALAPAAFSQEPQTPPTAQDPDSADVGEPAPQSQQDVPPTTTDEQAAPGATQPGNAQEPAAPDEDESAAPAPGGTTDNATAGPIEDKKIEQFADAYMAVQTIQQKAAAQLQSASNPEQADKVKATAESDMIAAVERSGLQVPEFNKIVERMASDTEVRSRVAAKLQERGGMKPGAKPDSGG
jgi:cytoskeletal protein RodZ